MNILLTGGAGYIGSHAAVVLTQAGHQAILYDNFFSSRPDVAGRLEKITGQSITVVRGDVRDTVLLLETLKNYQIETVIHFAGLKAVSESIQIPIDYYANNVQGTISLLQAMQANQLKTLIFSSSAAVYGDPQYLPIDEEHPTSPTNPYGRTKLQIEEILCDLAKSDKGWRIVCLRYFNPIGAHESGVIGEDPNGIPNNLMPYIAEVASGKLKQLNVFGSDYATPDGTGVRDYIHVMDLAEGHLAALKFLGHQSGWHTINLGTGHGSSVFEMIKAFEAASGKTVPYQISQRRLGDIPSSYAKVDKATQQLNWQAKRTMEDMCISIWNWQAQCKAFKP